MRLVLAMTMAAPLAVVAGGPAAADCESGHPWPTSPADVQGLTFIGTALDEAPEPAEDGTFVRFVVDELLAGTAGPGVLLGAWCVDTTFRPGAQYLVSTSGSLEGVGRMPEHAAFTAGEAVAWHLPGNGKAVLMGYGDASLREAPPWLRRAVSRDQAVHAVLPDSGPPVPAVTTTVEDDTFRLTIATDRDTYTTTDIIPVAATIAMLRTEATTIAGSGSGPVVFGVEQLDGPVDAGPSWTYDCQHHVWAPGQTEFVPFSKSGGYVASDPMAPFWIAFYNDADLVLPAGHYRVFAQTDYYISDCSGQASTLMAEVLIEVVDPLASPSPIPQEPAAEAFELYTHCGLARTQRHDGEYWKVTDPGDATSQAPTGLGDPFDRGTFVRTSPDSGLYTSESGIVLGLVRVPGPPADERPCR